MEKIIQPSFAAGELTPALAGRVDLGKYRVGAALLENFIVEQSGGVSNRAGFQFVADVGGPARLIPFKFSADQGVLLVFQDGVMKVIDGGGVVYASSYTQQGTPISDWTLFPNGALATDGTHSAANAFSLSFGGGPDSTAYWVSGAGNQQNPNSNQNGVTAFAIQPIPIQNKGVAYIGTDFGAGNPAKIAGFSIVQCPNGPFETQSNEARFFATQVSRVSLQYSSDGVNWLTLENFTLSIANPGVYTDWENHYVTVPLVSARYWRLLAASSTQVGATLSAGGGIPNDSGPWVVGALQWSIPSNTVQLQVPVPYSFADVGLLTYAQSADVIYFAHPLYPPSKLTRLAASVWEFSPVNFVTTTQPPSGLAAPYSKSLGATTVSVQYAVSTIDGLGSESLPSAAVTTTVNSPWDAGATVNVSWNAVPGATGYRVYKSDRGFFGLIGAVTTGQAKLAISAALSSGDASGQPKANAFDSDVTSFWESSANITGNVVYIGADLGSAQIITSFRINQGGKAQTNCVTSVILQSSTDGNNWRNEATFSLVGTKNTWESFNNLTSTSARYWRLQANSVSNKHWCVNEVEFRVTGVPINFTDDYINEDAGIGPLQDNNPFPITAPYPGTGDYPGAVAIFQERAWWGGTNNKPQTLWGSRVGQLESMSVATPLVDDDALNFTMDSRELNQIRYMLPLSTMVILTSGGEWILTGANGLTAVTPSSVSLQLQGYRGAAGGKTPPLVIGRDILFVQRNAAVIRELTLLSIYVSMYQANDVSIMARHLFENHKITEWAYQQDPFAVVWAIRDDGVLLGFTTVKEQDVWGWHHHTTQGNFVSIATVDIGNGQDEVYCLVTRQKSDGTTGYFVEMMAHRIPSQDMTTAVFLDASLSYSGAPLNVFGGLNHLIGQTVVALADGVVIRNLVVDNTGAVTLPNAASIVTIGLPYTASMQTMRLEYQAQEPTAQGRKRKISKTFVRLRNTRGLLVGPDFTKMTPMKFVGGPANNFLSNVIYAVSNFFKSFFQSQNSLTVDYVNPNGLTTGDKWINIDPKWTTDGQLCIQQPDPLPATVLAIIPEIETSPNA